MKLSVVPLEATAAVVPKARVTVRDVAVVGSTVTNIFSPVISLLMMCPPRIIDVSFTVNVVATFVYDAVRAKR
jgi:hypothetical protein